MNEVTSRGFTSEGFSLSGKFSGSGRRIGFGLSTGTGVQQWISG